MMYGKRYIDMYEAVKDKKRLSELSTYEYVGYYLSTFPTRPHERYRYDVLENNVSVTATVGVEEILTAIYQMNKQLEEENASSW